MKRYNVTVTRKVARTPYAEEVGSVVKRGILRYGYWLLLLLLTGCVPWLGVMGDVRGSVGSTSNGILNGGASLLRSTDTYRFYHGRDRRYGTTALVSLIDRVAEDMHRRYPDSRLSVGDLSGPDGGRISLHRSHRSGLDVDFAFFSVRTSHGNTPDGSLAAFDRFGVSVDAHATRIFDVDKNWDLVEALLTDAQTPVQWIFVSNGIKVRLIRHALSQHRDDAIIEKAIRILRQPRDALYHDDHFHVRICCPVGDEGRFCHQRPPYRHCDDVQPVVYASDDRILELALENL